MGCSACLIFDWLSVQTKIKVSSQSLTANESPLQ
jgi:hypothetical protein